jgi:hypothetical protein
METSHGFLSQGAPKRKAWEQDKYSVIVNSSVARPDGSDSRILLSVDKKTTRVFYFPAKVNSEHLQVK